MNELPTAAAMTGAELAAIRRRAGFKRGNFCGQVGILNAKLGLYESGRLAIPDDAARRARILDGQGATTKRVGIAAFGARFLIVKLSLIEAADIWIIEALPIVHDDRKSAVIAARDYAAEHDHEFVPIGF
jgi:hypothetical protein